MLSFPATGVYNNALALLVDMTRTPIVWKNYEEMYLHLRIYVYNINMYST